MVEVEKQCKLSNGIEMTIFKAILDIASEWKCNVSNQYYMVSVLFILHRTHSPSNVGQMENKWYRKKNRFKNIWSNDLQVALHGIVHSNISNTESAQSNPLHNLCRKVETQKNMDIEPEDTERHLSGSVRHHACQLELHQLTSQDMISCLQSSVWNSMPKLLILPCQFPTGAISIRNNTRKD